MDVDRQLRQPVERGIIVAEAGWQATPRRRAIERGVAMSGHRSSLPGQQRAKAVGWDDRPTTDADGLEPMSGDVRVNRGAA